MKHVYICILLFTLSATAIQASTSHSKTNNRDDILNFISSSLSKKPLKASDDVHLLFSQEDGLTTRPQHCMYNNLKLQTLLQTDLASISSITLFANRPSLRQLAKINLSKQGKAFYVLYIRLHKSTEVYAVFEDATTLYYTKAYVPAGGACCYGG